MRKTLLFVIFLLCINLASASYISIRTNTTIDDNQVFISISNLGDEPAKDVQISAELSGQKKEGTINNILGINQKMNETFEFNIREMNGVYPLIIITEYSDMNSYPFSSIIVNYFPVGESLRSDVFGKIDPIKLKEEENIKLVLKNLGESSKKISLRFIVPKELTIEKTEGVLNLDARSEGTLNTGLRRFSALTGSTYLIYALLEYDENDVHYTSIVSSTVRVVENSSWFKLPNWLIISLIAILIAILIIFQFKRKWTRKR